MKTYLFWTFFAIALFVGFAIGFAVNNSGISGKVVDADDGQVVDIASTCVDAYGSFDDYCRDPYTVMEYYEFDGHCQERMFKCSEIGFEKCVNGACK